MYLKKSDCDGQVDELTSYVRKITINDNFSLNQHHQLMLVVMHVVHKNIEFVKHNQEFSLLEDN